MIEWIDLASFVFMVLPNYGLSNSKLIRAARGKSAAPYIPAPYAFSIWGVIWAFNIWFLGKQVMYGLSTPLPMTLHILYIVTNLFQAGWSFSILNDKKGLSMFFIECEFPLLLTAFLIITSIPGVAISAYLSFTLWFSWITVATTISLWEYVSRKFNLPFFESTLWSLVLVTYAAVVSAYFLLTRSSAAYTAITIWGLIGIYNAKVNSRPPIRYYALTAAVVLSLLVGQTEQKLGF